jgi:hypothetical protein
MGNGAWPRWAALLAASLGILGLAVCYLAAMRLVIDASKPDGGYTVDERDALYLSLHGATVLVAVVMGYTLGYLARRQGLAWATLFAAAVVVVIAGTLVGSRELACEADVNDVVRHWECSR